MATRQEKCIGITVFDLLNEYFRLKCLATDTEKVYTSVVNTFVHDTGLIDLGTITEDVFLGWREAVLSRSSASTWNNYRRHFRALFRFSVKRRILLTNPITEVSAAPVGHQKKKICSPASVSFIISQVSAECDGWFWSILLKTLYYSGMRRKQLVGLNWGDLDFSVRLIMLRSSTSKTKKEWQIAIDDRLVGDLLQLRTESKRRLPEDINFDALQVFNLFLTRVDPNCVTAAYVEKRLSAGYVTNKLSKLGKLYGIKLSPHRLRHTYGTVVVNSMILDDGPPVGLKALQEQLGHSTISTTLDYVETNVEQLRKLNATLDSI